eukprot:6987941-Pyramimonas_sp.AAC.1
MSLLKLRGPHPTAARATTDFVAARTVRGLPPFYNTTSDRQKVEWIQRAKVNFPPYMSQECIHPVSYTHLRAHETGAYL